MSSANHTAARVLIGLGTLVCLLGVTAVVATLAGDGGAALLVIGVVAVIGGGFVALIGAGGRARLAERDRTVTEAELDARIAATERSAAATDGTDCAHEPSACRTCTAICALAGDTRR